MPSTTRQSLRYPASSDAPNGPQQLLNLASDVDGRPTWRGVGSAWPGNIAVGDTFYNTTLRCTMRAMTTAGSWKQDDIVFVTDDSDRTAFLASVTAAGLTLHEGFLVWQDDTNILYAGTGSNTLVQVSDTNSVESTYTPTWSVDSASAPSIGAGTLTGRYRKLSPTQGWFQIYFQLGANTSGGTGSAANGYKFSLPPGWTAGPLSTAVPGWYTTPTDDGGLTGLVSAGTSVVYPIRANQNNALVANGLFTAAGNSMTLSGVVGLA